MAPSVGSLALTAARAIVRWRWIVAAVWIVGAVLAYVFASGLSTLPSANVDFLIPTHAKAITVEKESLERFHIPLLAQIAVVQRDAAGLSEVQQARTAQTALALDQKRLPGFPEKALAFPLVNTRKVFPRAREHSTTAITYLFFSQQLDAPRQRGFGVRYARLLAAPDTPAWLTGSIPGQLEQSQAVKNALPRVEYATLAVIVVILGLYFRGLLAPLVTLGSAAISYVLAQRAVGLYSTETGSAVPHEIQPLLIVLLLGVVTDYSVFFLSGMRARLAEGEDRLEAATVTTRRFLPIIATAGLLVSAGVATLRVATLAFLQVLGPAMAITVFVGAVVAMTFVPAVMSILGHAIFWPGLPRAGGGPPAVSRIQARVLRLVANRRASALAALGVAVALGVAATGLIRSELEVTPIGPLTSGAPAKRAAKDAGRGFAPGIVGPTEILLVRSRPMPTRSLARFGRLLGNERGVAGVLGPGLVPEATSSHVMRTRRGTAARVLVVLEDTPFGPAAITSLKRVARSVPPLLARADLAGTTAGYAGATAIAQDTVDDIQHDLLYVLLAAFLVNVVLLMVFLRSLVAPLYLVGASALALAATIGLTTFVFQGVLDYSSLTYYVPIAVAVLLISFGSDYNVFVVGRIYQERRDRPLREAIEVAMPSASRAVTVAGVTLACSFATLALIPLSSFREFAFAMFVGVLLDTFVVRSLLIPALISTVGDRSWWPGVPGAQSAGREHGVY